jgi:TIGR03009 family protein
MRRILALVVVAVGSTALAQAPRGTERRAADPPRQGTVQATPKPVDPKNAAQMEALLRQWETESASNQTLTVWFNRSDVSKVFKDQTDYVGAAVLKSPNLAGLRFDRKTGSKAYTPEEMIVCDGKSVYQFLYSTRQVYIYPLDPKDRQRALQEGPLPFLFNMKTVDAKARYRMELLQENETQYLIAVTPRLKIDRDAFSTAYIWLNKKDFMPSRLRLLHPTNPSKEYQEFVFTKLERNGEVNLDNFNAAAMVKEKQKQDPPWDVLTNPDANAVQAKAAGRGRPAQPAARPAPGARR